MAKNDYKNVEKIKELLGESQLGGLRKRLSATEKSLNDILKKLNAMLSLQKITFQYYCMMTLLIEHQTVQELLQI